MAIEIKRTLSKVIRSFGIEIVRYRKSELAQRAEDPELKVRSMAARRALTRAQKGEISLNEARLLAKLVSEIARDGPIVEIGTLFGHSTMVMLVNKQEQNKIISVDNYGWNPLGLSSDQHYSVTSARLGEAVDSGHLELRHIDKNVFYEEYSGPAPALVFADAIHSYEETAKDIAWAKKVNARIICGHDYTDKWPGVMRAVDEAGGAKQLVESLWVL